MAKTSRPADSWLFSPKSFISLLGAEYEMLKDAGSNVLRRFYITAVAIVTICIISMLSIVYAIDMLFHMLLVEIPMAIFISLLFLVIYILLINTFTKEKEDTARISVSNITRIGFVVFMAFIVSKPVEVWFMKDMLNTKVEKYKQTLLADHQKGLQRLYGSDMAELHLRLQQVKEMAAGSRNVAFDAEISNVDARISALRQKIKDNMEVALLRINGSDFLIYRVAEVVRRPVSWLICAIIIALFILPGLLIYAMSTNNVYFRIKKDHEKALVSAAYKNFSASYSKIAFGLNMDNVSFYTVFEDPPFNTRRFKDAKYNNGDNFFDKYFAHP